MSFSCIPFKYDKKLYNKAKKLQKQYSLHSWEDGFSTLFCGHVIGYTRRLLCSITIVPIVCVLILVVFHAVFHRNLLTGTWPEHFCIMGISVALSVIPSMYAKFADKIYWFFSVISRPFRRLPLSTINLRTLLTNIYTEDPSFKLHYTIKEHVYTTYVEYYITCKILDAYIYIGNNTYISNYEEAKGFNTPEQADDYIKKLVKESKQLAIKKLKIKREKYNTKLYNNYKLLDKRLQHNKECNIKKYI